MRALSASTVDAILLVILVSSTAAACDTGSSNDAGTDPLAEYCEQAEAYDQATSSMEGVDPASMIDSFAVAAREARRFAEVAPAEVRGAHSRVAEWAEALVDRYQEHAPALLEEFERIGRDIVADLTAALGDLEAEIEEVKRFASDACGLSLE